jgi:hypothetical protein
MMRSRRLPGLRFPWRLLNVPTLSQSAFKELDICIPIHPGPQSRISKFLVLRFVRRLHHQPTLPLVAIVNNCGVPRRPSTHITPNAAETDIPVAFPAYSRESTTVAPWIFCWATLLDVFELFIRPSHTRKLFEGAATGPGCPTTD